MKIVIDIPDGYIADDYFLNNIQNGSIACGQILKAVKNGIPLPKDHGRLIDADAYINKTAECGWLDDISVDEFNRITQTIIEADKLESEE